MNLLLLLLACDRPTPPTPPPTSYATLTPAALEVAMQALLRASGEEELVSSPIAGAVGPRGDCGVATISSAPGGRLGLLLSCDGVASRSGPIELWLPEEGSETLIADVNGDGQAEVIVVARYTSGMGPDGMIPFQANSVMRWDGARWEHLLAVEEQVRGLESAAEVRAALAKRLAAP
jgi:hypothetical protein